MRLFGLFIFFLAATSTHAATVIHAGLLIDGRADQPKKTMSIVVDGGKITKIVEGFIKPEAADTLVDLREYTVLPGLMDMHTHLMSQFSKDRKILHGTIGLCASVDGLRQSNVDGRLYDRTRLG
jgi:N-acyl-D-aspartate/D-glutamate deacylase